MSLHCRVSAVICAFFLVLSIHAQGSEHLINLNPDPHGEPWIAGGLDIGDWEAMQAELPELQLGRMGGLSRSLALPVRITNHTRPEFRPIFNQKGGSCAQASAVGYVYTYEINSARKLASNVLENQYPYDFTYNFLNNGSGSVGSNSANGWSIIQANGIPNAGDYGGANLGQHTRWISGYDIYRKGMSNRLLSQFSITIRTAADIDKMRQWLVDRGNGSAQGGCLVFGAEVTGQRIVTLATGTPQGGKKAIVAFGSGGGHAMTIAGYDDEVRYDYNGDGRYTNDIDLNGDGIIDVRDWEIGAVLMVNSWGTGWQNSGTAYVMYRCLAEAKANGGISSNRVSGINVDFSQPTVDPRLTFKVRLSHSNRGTLRLRAGFANTVTATNASTYKTFAKAFNYAGGAFPMQGINTEAIEIGLDVSDFISRLTGSEASFFLEVTTTDGMGTLQRFSLLDHTTNPVTEYVCSRQNVDITPGTQVFKIVRSAATLQVVSPNGGEQWERGRPFEIAWTSTITENIKIELLKGGVLHSTIAASAPNTRSYLWSIPSGLTTGTDYRIRVTSATDAAKTDMSDNVFSIGETSTIEITAPNGGEILHKGSSTVIAWKRSTTGTVNLDLYAGGIFVRSIASGRAGTGTFTWTIPVDIPGKHNYRVRVTAQDKPWLADESDGVLSIVHPVVKAPYTQNFDLFKTGDTLTASWEQVDDDDFQWLILGGPTPSRVNPRSGGTGPSGDRTSGSGKYIYVEASEPNHPGKDAHLLSPYIDIRDISSPELRFWYHMHGISDTGMGDLWVDIYANGAWREVFHLTKNQGDAWKQKVIPLSSLGATHVQVRFRARTGLNYDGDICIDDFQVVAGQAVAASGAALFSVRQRIAITSHYALLEGFQGPVRICALNGAVVVQSMINGSGTIDISRLPRGVYLLRAGNKTVRFTRKR